MYTYSESPESDPTPPEEPEPSDFDSDGYWLFVDETQGLIYPEDIGAILGSIGAGDAALMVTLIWNAQSDIDLHFFCDDGTEIWYSSPGPAGNCQGRLD